MAENGSIYGSPAQSAPELYAFWADWKLNNYSIEKNTSNITVWLRVKRIDGTNAGAYELAVLPKVELYVGGTLRTPTVYHIDTRNQVECTFAIWTGDVKHNSDGTLSCPISANFTHYGSTTLTGGTLSGSADLDTIPQATSVDSVTCATQYFTGKLTYKYTPKAASLYSRCVIYLNQSGTLTSVKSINLGQKSAKQQTGTVTLSDSELQIIYKKITASPVKGTLRFTIRTYSNSGYSSQVGQPSIKEIELSIPNNESTKPTASVKVSPISSLPSTFNGLYIQGKTKVQVKLSSSGKYGADVKSKSVTVGGQKCSANGDIYTSNYLQAYGSTEVKATVVDTRDFPNTASQKIDVIAYDNPKVVNVTVARSDGSGNLSESGTSLTISAKRSYSPVKVGSTQKNFCQIRYRVKTSGGSYGSWTTLLAKTATGDTVTKEVEKGKISAESTYVVQVQAIDDMGFSSPESTINVPTDKVYMHRTQNGLAVGKYAEHSGLDVGWPVFMNGNKIVELADPTADTDAANKAYVDNVADSVPLHDAFKTSGVFNGDYNDAQTDPNFKYWGTWWTQPAGGACSNYPEGATYGFLTTKKTNNIPTQIYTQYSNGKTWERSYVNNGWHGWFRQDGLDCAPSGFIHEVFTPITTNEAITDALNATIADMPDKTMRYIRLVIGAGSLWLTQTNWVVLLYKHSASYGFAIATAYGSESPVQAFNSFYNGEWKGFGFVNPTANAGTAYRTAERYRGKTVYTKVLSYGTTANQKAVDTGLAVSKYLIIRYAGTLNGTPLPYHYTDTNEDAWFRVYAGATNYGSMLHIPAADAGLSNTFLQIWYCEK